MPLHTTAKLFSTAIFHAYTLYLFIATDVKTMVIPNCIFATLSNPSPSLTASLRTLLLVTIHLLAFTISNQLPPTAILEDTINKPWRPLPSARLTPQAARRLKHLATVAAIGGSCFLFGGVVESGVLLAMFWLYNDYGLGAFWASKTLLNAAGFCMFAAGAAAAAKGSMFADIWTRRRMGIVAATVATTIHSQDLYDQQGDLAAGRSTVPLRFGESWARWSHFSGVGAWSVLLVCMYYEEALLQSCVSGALGVVVAVRSLTGRSAEQDKSTFLLWNVWLVSIYLIICSG